MKHVLQLAGLYAVFAIMAMYVGEVEHLFKFGFTDEWAPFIITAVVAIVLPTALEEVTFRVFLPWWAGKFLLRPLADLLAVGLFVLWHPVQVWAGLPLAQPLFLEPGFLMIVAVLGGLCQYALRLTGSLWPALVMHWLTVVAWKGLLAG